MGTKIHMMGIGGSGISGVANLASKMGYEVTGCDVESSTAYVNGIYRGHSVDHLKGIDFLVVSPAIYYQNSKNPELVEGEKRGIAMTWQEFLGKILLKDKKLICIAGTHGKSTTTAMAGKLLIDNGFDPTIVVGANVPEWGGNSRFGKGEYAIVEADEFNNNFLNYHPEIAIINNIEFDHPDFFKNEQEVREAFKKFAGNLVGEKTLITEKDSEHKKLNLKVFGEHNQNNANLVYVLGKKLGIDEVKITKSLESFSGIGRRMDLIADRSGIKVFDDYAHHPTAIKTTIEGIRKEFPDSRIWVIDEPHGFARTKALLPKYENSFNNADKVLIGPIFKARDKETFGMTPGIIAKTSKHKDANGYNSFDEIKKILKGELKTNDVVLVMGAGKSYLWAREIVALLPVRFADITTFHIGGPIRKYFEVKNGGEIKGAVSFAKDNNLPIFIIGGGSDILANDKEFNGVVIKFTGADMSYLGDGKINSQAGALWDDLVKFSVERNLQGIECLSGIPGSVGGSPIQNIGAYGQELKDTFVKLTAFDIDKNKFVEFGKEDCDFGYRESIFKKSDRWQKFIITDITLKLTENGKPLVVYDSLKNYLTENKIINPTLQDVREYIKSIRAGKFENPREVGNAGSFFKNPILSKDEVDKLKNKYPGIPAIIQKDGKYKCSAGWFVETAGWKGKKYKNAAVSKMHALILLNPELKATASEVMELSEKIIKDVEEKFGIKLEREVQLINFLDMNYKQSLAKSEFGEGKKVAILGYGIEGTDAEAFLKKTGADITILDRKFDPKYLDNLERFDVIVRSPGVYRFLPEIVEAEKSGAVIISAVKIFFENCPAKTIGVTGTKGKGTTSTLIYEILKAGGRDTYLAGNIGKPYLDLLPKLTKDSWVIMEMSSFQLIDLDLSPHIAVVLNITMDHMDWHKDAEEYVDAKKNIVLHQNSHDFAVINGEYDTPKSFARNLKSKVIFFSKKSLEPEFKEDLLLRGEHNLENIAAAVAVAKIAGVDKTIIENAVKNFKGLEHRLELVAEIDGRTFYNDSFATGPQPTIAAIKSFTEPETLILGGSDKGLDYSELGSVIRSRSNVKNIILIGQIRNKIADTFKGASFKGRVIDMGKPAMKEIVERAFAITPKGGVIILSPGAASFDMFANYKDRGNQFKESVLNLKK